MKWQDYILVFLIGYQEPCFSVLYYAQSLTIFVYATIKRTIPLYVEFETEQKQWSKRKGLKIWCRMAGAAH